MSSSFQDPIEPHAAFDAKEYAGFLFGRWRFILAVAALAGTLAWVAGLLTSARYTSTASILIEAPAGNDARISTSVTPVYLESLKTYEVFATSDALFLQAVGRFHLREGDGGQTIEALKSRILRVAKLRDTKVMQISVTLKNPRDAQAMAQFLAEETVKLSNSIARDSGASLVADAQGQADAAKAKADEAQAAFTKESAGQPIDVLKSELDSMIELQYRLRRNQSESATGAAEYDSLANSPDADRAGMRSRGASLRASAELANKQSLELGEQIAAKSARLAQRSALLRKLDADLASAQRTYEAASKRAQESKASLGMSGERLKIIDPGGIPERPSEPRIALQVAAALGVALLAAIVYLSLRFSFRP